MILKMLLMLYKVLENGAELLNFGLRSFMAFCTIKVDCFHVSRLLFPRVGYCDGSCRVEDE